MVQLKRAVIIILGSLFISIGINNFFVPYQILDGGIIGLGLVLHYLWHFKIGVSILTISFPIYLFAWFYNRQFFYNSIIGLIFSALFIDIFSFLTIHSTYVHPLVAAIIGGTILGVGVGLLFLYDVSTGGLDLLAQMIASTSKINVGIVIFLIDLFVVSIGLVVVQKGQIILSIIAVSATGFTTTMIMNTKK